MHGLMCTILPVLLAVAAGVGCGLLAWAFGSAVDPFLLGAIFSAVIGLLHLGAGIRHLLTGLAKDLLEMQKIRLEIEKLRWELAKAQARVREPSADEVAAFGTGELKLDRYKGWEREERFL